MPTNLNKNYIEYCDKIKNIEADLLDSCQTDNKI